MTYDVYNGNTMNIRSIYAYVQKPFRYSELTKRCESETSSPVQRDTGGSCGVSQEQMLIEASKLGIKGLRNHWLYPWSSDFKHPEVLFFIFQYHKFSWTTGIYINLGFKFEHQSSDLTSQQSRFDHQSSLLDHQNLGLKHWVIAGCRLDLAVQ